jgi:DNA gyrase subunit A
MNAEELWETTMDPAHRLLLQVTLDDAAQADELFSVLMGEDVEAAPLVHPAQRQGEMQRSYLDYAMSVIVGRALPDVRDGLKPVHRRVLYAMHDGGYRLDRGLQEVRPRRRRRDGQVPPARRLRDLRRAGPHGAAVLDALPLVDGQGNFGSSTATTPRPMRYTECRLAARAWRCSPTSTRTPSTSGQLRRPRAGADWSCRRASRTCWSTAPAASRSAWPPTSRRTTCARSPATAPVGAGAPGRRPARSSIDALIEIIKGPDFPTGGLIVGPRRHRGGLPHRPRLDHPCARSSRSRRIRQGPHLPGRHRAAVPGQPGQPGEKIAELVTDGKLEGIADVRDETSSDRTGSAW